MLSITIRHVPEDVRNELAARAQKSGRSLQEYLHAQLLELASKPDPQALLATIRERKARTGTMLATERILEYRDADRS